MQKTILINKKLRDAMSDIDIKVYTAKFTMLSNEEFKMKRKLEVENDNLFELVHKLELLENQRNRMLEELKKFSKSRNTYYLTENVSKIMSSVISTLTTGKFCHIESSMLSMLKSILRKDNFIDLVELDEDFNIYIYKKQGKVLQSLLVSKAKKLYLHPVQ